VLHVTSVVKKITMNVVVVSATDLNAEHVVKKVTNPSTTNVMTNNRLSAMKAVPLLL
jgi:hypothetical protein